MIEVCGIKVKIGMFFILLAGLAVPWQAGTVRSPGPAPFFKKFTSDFQISLSFVPNKPAASVFSAEITTVFSDPPKAREEPDCAGRYGYTQEEVYQIAQVVYEEARGEPFEGQVAVAAVILNRVESEDFPDTVYGVLSEANAFSTWSTVEKEDPVPDNSVREAVEFALENRDMYPDTMVWFRAGRYHTYGEAYRKIGGHYFNVYEKK